MSRKLSDMFARGAEFSQHHSKILSAVDEY